MSQGTRLLLFHDDGELRQVLFPRLTPLWILTLISTLSLFALIFMVVSLRLYHEKRQTLRQVDELTARIGVSDLRLKQMDPHQTSVPLTTTTEGVTPPAEPVVPTPPAPQAPAAPASLPATGDQTLRHSLAQLVGGMQEMDNGQLPLELAITKKGREGPRPQIVFGIKAKQPSEQALLGFVCGVFFSKNSVVFLPNTKAEKGWMERPTAILNDGRECDSFKIKNAKWYTVEIPSALEWGMIRIYSDNGQLLKVTAL